MKENSIIWTRVSTKHQEDNGGSLVDQKQKCEDYAQQHDLNIKGYYGGTHESAKTPGKMVKEMVSTIKKDKSIRNVLIAKGDRFSRNAGQGISILNELRDLGINVVEVGTGLDTSTPEGLMMLQMKICMAQWDNTNRTNNFTSGRKNCMRNGVYCGPAPLGYDKEGKSLNSTFTINSDGYLIRKAFQWKLQGMANCDILTRLAERGLHLRKQRLQEILTNPFYSGLIVNKMLDYEPVEGKHPKIVSREDFLRVQEILKRRMGIYKHKKETPRFPLKRFVRCWNDRTYFTAYTVKKKGIDYYKCNVDGCKTNVSAKRMHRKFEELLRTYNIPLELVCVLRDVIGNIISIDQKQQKEVLSSLKKKKSECEGKMKKCRIKYATDMIDEETFEITMATLQEELQGTDLQLAECNHDLSNLEKRIDEIFVMCCNLVVLWKNGTLETSQKLQNLLFPDGIFWDKEIGGYRTEKENRALAVMRRITDFYKNKKEKNFKKISSLPQMCG